METQLRAAIGAFFAEFSKFETLSVGRALQSLSHDPAFVASAEKLLDLDARLTLVERMAFAREVPPKLAAELERVLARARKLLEQRDAFASSLMKLESRPIRAVPRAERAEPDGYKRRRRAEYERLAALETLCVPPIARVREHTDHAIELQRTLSAIAQRIESPYPQGPAAR